MRFPLLCFVLFGVLFVPGVSFAGDDSDELESLRELLVGIDLVTLEAALADQSRLMDLYLETATSHRIYLHEIASSQASRITRSKAQRALESEWVKAAVNREGVPTPLSRTELEDIARERYEHFKRKTGAPPEKRRFSHILVNTRSLDRIAADTIDGFEAPKTVDDLVGFLQFQLGVGAKFEDLAQRFSIDSKSAIDGGALPGWTTKGEQAFVPEFEKAAFALEHVGQISHPVRTKFGIHLIRLDDVQLSEWPDFEHVKLQFIEKIVTERRGSARSGFLAKFYPDPSKLDQEHFKKLLSEVISKVRNALESENK